ncbi:hypothetical protein NXF25_015043 [Crotalus adamanteus]|uniref:Uncharacterized protein n=1 Tax=Crotalus adamanteus TaxID=8729 RepID=A0AAW1AXQ9_CROAD
MNEIWGEEISDSVTHQEEQLQICCFVFPVSYYKTGYNIVACTNCLLLLLISISPYWLMHPEGEYVFSLGFWTKCYEHKCYIITDSTTILTVARTLVINAIICSLTALILSRNFFIHCLKINISEDLPSSIAHFITAISLLGILVITSEKLKYEFGDIILFLNWDFYLGCCICALCIILGE